MKKQLCTILSVLVLVCGCSWMPSLSDMNPFAEEPGEKTVSGQLGVNPYLWQAALSKLSFMPLQSADSKGGVIVTDWAAMDNAPSERFKVTVHILSRDLRADCLKVTVFKRVYRDGKWVGATPDKRLSGEIENAILTQAQILFRRDLAGRGE